MMSDEHKKAMSDQDIDAWLDQEAKDPNAEIVEEPELLTKYMTEMPEKKKLKNLTTIQNEPAPGKEISLGSMPQFAEILFRPNGEIWLNTDLFQLAIQPGISRILLGQPEVKP